MSQVSVPQIQTLGKPVIELVSRGDRAVDISTCSEAEIATGAAAAQAGHEVIAGPVVPDREVEDFCGLRKGLYLLGHAKPLGSVVCAEWYDIVDRELAGRKAGDTGDFRLTVLRRHAGNQSSRQNDRGDAGEAIAADNKLEVLDAACQVGKTDIRF
ncbi:MAG: hypothetical protein IPJ99_15000 [Betaproteobacteria bacterium]|nr:hypothetical protein [Betaproteobacteria bacterium]